MAGEARQKLRNAAEAAAAEAKNGGRSSHAVNQNGSYKAPGRLGDPGLELKDEPRVDARLLAAVSPIGMDRSTPPQTLAKLNGDSSIDEIAEMIAEFENGITMRRSCYIRCRVL